MINTEAIIGCCIATAFHQRQWCPDTELESAYEDFEGIIEQATENAKWCGLVLETPITEFDVAESIWGYEAAEEFFAELEENA